MRRSPLWWLPLFLLSIVVNAAPGAASDQTRLALVVGNAAYRAGRLPTAADDAGLVAQSLAQAGYDVTAMADCDAATLHETFGRFLDKIRRAGADATIFVYLAGYGVQYDGDNLLVPVDAVIDRQADVPGATVKLSEISQAIEALPARARVFVYDLAREAPFARLDAAPLAAGLALVRAPHGSLYAFNAAPGTVAGADIPPYGLYARALAEMLRTPGLTPETLFARVRLRVAEITGGTSIPWDDSGLEEDVVLVPGDGAPPTRMADRPIEGVSVESGYWIAIARDRLDTYRAFVRAFPDDRLASRVRGMIAARLEATTWSESVQARTAVAFWTFMQRYPRGPHYVDVRRRLALLQVTLEPPSRFTPFDFVDLPPPTSDQVHGPDRLAPIPGFDDADGVPSPVVPGDLLPPPPNTIYLELAPPPFVPKGALPIPAPLALGTARVSFGAAGRIEELVPDLGRVTVESLGGAMSLASEDGPVTRTTTTSETGRRTILQTDAADEIVSQTTSLVDGLRVTQTQTGPDGRVRVEIVTRIDPLGERSTTVSNGLGQLVAEVRADRRGIVREVTRGPASLDEPTFAVLSSNTPRTEPGAALPPTSGPASKTRQ